MKKAGLLFLSVLFCFVASSQNITNYQFSASAGTFTPLSGGTTMALSGGTVNDGWFNAVPIGFTFYYIGVAYTSISAATNGWMTFGQDISNAYSSNNLSSSGLRPLVAPLWGDLDIQLSTNFSYQTMGTAPTRIFTAEWRNVKWGASASGAVISFQVNLYEATGKIEFVYQQEPASVTVYASIGITASATGSGQYLSLNGSGTNPTVSSTSSYNYIWTKPANGQTYSFSSQSSSPDSPVNMTFSSITQTSMTMNWVDNSTNETYFLVDFSEDGINYSQTSIATTSVATTGTAYMTTRTGLLPGVTYYYRVSACNEGNAPSAMLTGNFATLAPGNFVSVTSGNWSNASTWSTGSVPTWLDNVTIAEGHTVTIDGSCICYGLTVGQGISGVLRFGTTTASLTTFRGVTVATGGIFDAGATSGANLSHQLNIGGSLATGSGTGNLLVNGTFNMYIGSTYGKCNVTFFGIPDASVSGSGSINFHTITLNKGTTTANALVTPPVLEFMSAFTVQGSGATGFLSSHTAGTLKIGGTFAMTNPVYSTAAYIIPATGALWVNNPNFTVSGMDGNPANNGLLKLSSGTLNIGAVVGNTMGAATGAVFYIEGGIMNIACRLNTSNAVIWHQSNGEVKITTVGNATASAPGFGLTNSGSVFNMSGGTLYQVLANSYSSVSSRIDFYNNAGTTNISGGTLQLGNSASGTTALTFRIRGTAPNVFLSNASANHNLTLSEDLTIRGNLTLNGTGVFLNNSKSLTMTGMNGTNPGNITIGAGFTFTANSSASALLTFNSSHGNQSLTNNGTITGTTTPQIPGLVINNTFGGEGTVTIPGGLSIIGNATLNLTKGTLNVGTGITLGTASTTGFTYLQGNGVISGTVTRNYGSGTVNYTYNGTLSQIAGPELPSSITGTLTINNGSGVTLNAPLQAGKLTLTSGTLTTTATKMLTISGTAVADLTYTSGQVNGPLQRTLKVSQGTGSTFLFPLGKSSYRPLELVNPITNAGGTVVIKVEVFDAACGGTPGTDMNALNSDRYWVAEITAGSGNFTSTTVRLTETGLTVNSGLGKSATQTGSYDLVSSAIPSGNTLITDLTTSLGYYAIGLKSMQYVSSTTNQTNTGILRQASADQQIIGIQVVMSGNLDPAILSSMTLNTNGSTSAADLTSAKVFYSGTSNTFAATNQFGTTYPSPSGSFTITGSQALAEGTNYFWLAYDISLNAGNNDLVDGECNSITVNSSAKTPTVQAPGGSRTVKGSLTGTYTIGSSGSYPTLTGAGGLFEAVNDGGLKGNTTIQIVSNLTETGTFALSEIYEAGGSGFTLTIQPDAATERIISGAYAGGLIRLSGADRVTIDGRSGGAGTYLTIINTATSGTIAPVQLIGTAEGQGCAGIMIRNCNLSNGHNGFNSYGIALGGTSPDDAGYDHDQVTLQNCSISKAFYGIYAKGNSSGTFNDLVISGNSIGSLTTGSEIAAVGIYAEQAPGSMVSGNTVFNIFNATTEPRGIEVATGSINSTVSGNEVTGVRYTGASALGAIGIYIRPGFIIANINVVNNIISEISGVGNSIPINNGIFGIKVTYCQDVFLYYNTVNLSGNVSHASSGDKSAALYVTAGATPMRILVKNNILKNTIINTAASATAYALYSDMDRFNFSTIDYNDYFIEESQGRLGYMAGSTATTIYQWRTITQQDQHSTGDDPLFTSTTDLQLDFSSPAYHTGDPVAGITTDFANVTRDATTPSMGALETAHDGQGPVISYTSLTNTSLLSDRTLTATLTDDTGVPVSGPGLPVLYWNINHGTWNAATGVFISGSDYSFTFGAGVTTSDSVFYFLAAQDTKASPSVSVNPSTGAGGFSSNPPSCSTKPVNPSSYKILLGLTGTITVGSGGNYLTLTGAGGLFQTINENLLSSNVTASVISDLSEPGTYSLLKWSEEGAGNYTLSIVPDGTTERLIAGNVAAGLITLKGALRAIINGSPADTTARYLRIRNTNASPVIRFLNGARYNMISNCHLESAVTGNGVISFSTSTVFAGNSNNQILRNAIHGRTDAVGVPAYGIHSQGTSANPNKTNTIRGNEISNFSYMGIRITPTGNGGEWVISGNSFFNDLATPPSTPQRGISFEAGNLSFGNYIAGNYIGGDSPLCGGEAWENSSTSYSYGIYINSGFASNYILDNTIANFYQNNIDGWGFYGIYVYEGWCQIRDNTIGNAVLSKSIRSAAEDGELYGINVVSSMKCNVENNTIANLGFTASSGSPMAYGIYVYGANIKMNNLYGLGHCTNSGISPTVYGVYNSGLYMADAEISNNSIAIDGGLSAEPQIYGYYDYSYTENAYDFFYNSISISGPATTFSDTYAFYRDIDAAMTMSNNVLANFRLTNGGGQAYAVFIADTGNLVSDFNDLYCPNGFLGYYDDEDIPDLPAWQTSTLGDQFSISSDPLFTNNMNDLMPGTGSPLIFAGVPLPDVDTDISSNPRDPGATTIGCHESGIFTSKTWNGSVSSDWNDGSNWTPAGVPGVSDNVAIPSNTLFDSEIETPGMNCGTLVIGNSALFKLISGGILTINGNLVLLNGGTLDNSGLVNLKGDLRNLGTAE